MSSTMMLRQVASANAATYQKKIVSFPQLPHSAPATPTASCSNVSPQKQLDYEDRRSKFITSMYKDLSPSSSNSSTSISMLIPPSSTDDAASDSFIRDSNSPLLNARAPAPLSTCSVSARVALKSMHNVPNRHSQQLSMHNYTTIVISKPCKASSQPPPIKTRLQPAIIHQKSAAQRRHESNIEQKNSATPPKKMKKQASVEELQLVIDHFREAENRDFEAILAKHEPHILYYRDKLYAEARQSGITASSNEVVRLKILGAVVDFAYHNVEPPNEYTKKTDRKHFKEVAAWTARFAKKQGQKPSLSLIFAAWCHDVERFIPATKCEYLPEAVDKYRKQVIHGMASARVALCLLKGAPVSEAEREHIYQLVLHHDIPQPRLDVVIADEVLVVGATQELMTDLQLLMDADAFAFFQSTIYFFILFKAKKNSPDWIWERVVNNVKRLRPYLRQKAVACIKCLPEDVRAKMAIDYEEIELLCREQS